MSRVHTDRSFEAELNSLRQAILMMAGRVEEMIARSVQALVEGDIDLARDVIASDRQVNLAEVDIGERCFTLLARWQPMASDLRLIVIGSRMATDLERIGDLAVNICERAIDLYGTGRAPGLDEIQRMAERVQEMVGTAVDAFVKGDANAVQAVLERDDEVDDLYHKLFRDLLDRISAGEGSPERCISQQNVAKYLERIGDHATNLAEEVIFMVKGRDIRHEGKLPP